MTSKNILANASQNIKFVQIIMEKKNGILLMSTVI